MQRGSSAALGDIAAESGEHMAAAPEAPRNEGAVEHEGFNLHASVAIAADDDLGRERLCRYGARPPLALERLRRLPDGRVAYRIKKLRGGRAKHRIMTPLEFLARCAALVPPPRYPLVRYHGVLAPRSPWRPYVVPRRPGSSTCTAAKAQERAAARGFTSQKPDEQGSVASRSTAQTHADSDRSEPSHGPPQPPLPSVLGALGSDAPVLLTPNILASKHWERLLGGRLYAATQRVDWATLLRRTFQVDVLQCAQCGGRLRLLGEVTDPAVIRLVLEAVGLPTDALRAARARDPTALLGEPDVN